MTRPKSIALFDLDGTLVDYELGLSTELERLRAPSEPIHEGTIRNVGSHIKARADLIRASEEWWTNLPKFQLGWDILKITQELDFHISILTQGPRRNPSSWSGKKIWMDQNLGEDVDITITRDKSLVYGRVLVDDYPGYIKPWLEYRSRGLVIMPANEENKSFSHPQVIRYNGTNLTQVRTALTAARNREDKEKLNFEELTK